MPPNGKLGGFFRLWTWDLGFRIGVTPASSLGRLPAHQDRVARIPAEEGPAPYAEPGGFFERPFVLLVHGEALVRTVAYDRDRAHALVDAVLDRHRNRGDAPPG